MLNFGTKSTLIQFPLRMIVNTNNQMLHQIKLSFIVELLFFNHKNTGSNITVNTVVW